MRTLSITIYSVAIAAVIELGGCSNSVTGSPVYLGVTIAPRPASIPAGTSAIFTGTVSNNVSLPQWSILDASDSANPGTLTAISGSPTSILYTAPSSPPIYTVTPTGVTQGTVTLDASVADPAGTSSPISTDAVTFVVTTPFVTVNLTPLAANVPLAGTQQFFGYAVGNLDNTLNWYINGILGGSSTVGTVNAGGTYVAPANMPMSGATVTLTIVSQADPTRTAAATITLH